MFQKIELEELNEIFITELMNGATRENNLDDWIEEGIRFGVIKELYGMYFYET